jgi:predicted PurR-regulated permease PerM
VPIYFSAPRGFIGLATLGISLWLLSWLEPLLIPIALAILLTFLLSPAVTLLERRRLARVPAVLVMVAITFAFLGIFAWLVARQVTGLVDTYPQYEQNLTAKLEALHSSEAGFIDKLQSMVERISYQLQRKKRPLADNPLPESGAPPMPVTVIQDSSPFQLSRLWSVLGPTLEPFAAIGLTIVLLVFMLIRREDLRDRVISLVGRSHLTVTTKALDEAGERISRYLLTQFAINASYGAAVAAGLFFIGVPYALLWGFFAALFRYIPYLGAWLAALLPIGLTLLVSETWTTPLLVLAWFLMLELVTNMWIEPWLFGRGIGVSTTATLVMVAFWAWLWGPIGLVLATPLTVCLVVLGKYVPALSFFDTLLGDQPAMEAPVGYYQRLLARDQDEAAEIAAEHLKANALGQVFDGLLVPALVYAKRDVDRQALNEDDQRFIIESTRDVVAVLVTLGEKTIRTREVATDASNEDIGEGISVLGCAARDVSDEAALLMLQALLDLRRYKVSLIASGLLASDLVEQIREVMPAVVCIAALPPGGVARARLLCLRLRTQFPDIRILIGRWGDRADIAKLREQLINAGADEVATTLEDTVRQMATLRPSLRVCSKQGNSP